MNAGLAERNVTPEVGLEITHPVRTSVAVHDPLFARALVLQDSAGTMVAILTADLIGSDLAACDRLRTRIAEALGIKHVLINFSHPHSTRGFDGYAELKETDPAAKAWSDATQDAFVQLTAQAADSLVPVTLAAGRASVQIGFNRRVMGDSGEVYMDVNEAGQVVPWVNVLTVTSRDGDLMGVLFEHAAHPVIVPDHIATISADYPGIAAQHLRDDLGGDVIPMFAQGCGADINGYPLRSSMEHACAAGRTLADAVLIAMKDATPIAADTLNIRTADTELPLCELPSADAMQTLLDNVHAAYERGELPHSSPEGHNRFLAHFGRLIEMLREGKTPPPWHMQATAVMLGDEWALVAMQQESFCEYELWIDANAPAARTMAFSYTNGATGYIPTDEALALRDNGGYEASCLPALISANVWTRHFGPPGVGAEVCIKTMLASLWS
jgi:hypothetical protein